MRADTPTHRFAGCTDLPICRCTDLPLDERRRSHAMKQRLKQLHDRRNLK
jgi:hypothetical protein